MSRSFLAASLFVFLLLPSSSAVGTIHGHGSGGLITLLNAVAAQAREAQREIDERETNAFLRRLQRELDREYYDMQRTCPQGRPE
jgi:hypothetical protein